MRFSNKIIQSIVYICIATILLAGCTTGKSADKAIYTAGKPIVEYNGHDVSSNQVLLKMNYYLSQHNMSLNALRDDPGIWDRFKNDIVFELALNEIALEKAEELGLSQLTEEEQASLDSVYDYAMKQADERVKNQLSVLNPKEKDFDKTYDALLNEYFFQRGYHVDRYRDALEQELIVEKVKKHVTDDIQITDAEVRQEYDNALNTQKANMEKQPSSIEQQRLFGTEILYYPEGYMYVKHILISFDSSIRGAAAIAYESDNVPKYNELVLEGYQQIKPQVDEIMQKLDDGADFDTLMQEYSDDLLFSEEPYKSEGFFIGPYSSFDQTEYLEALYTLKEQGAYSQPVKTYMGCYIIKCEKMLAGAVPFSDVKESMSRTLLEQRKSFRWSSLGQEWIDAATENGTLKLFTSRIDDYITNVIKE